MTEEKIQTIGFVGAGIMGQGMAGNLLKAGFSLNLFSRTKSKAEHLIENGAVWMPSVQDVASQSDIIITIVGMVEDVEQIYWSKDGILSNAKSNTIIVDMTTSNPELAKRIYKEASQRGIRALDAPVSGGDTGAQEGSLSIMVGGDKDAFCACLPVFEAMGENIVYQGEAGSGQNTKMCNQIALAATMLGVCEALAYAQNAGLDPETVLQSISNGAAKSWVLSNLAPEILSDKFDPGFFVKHFIKDMKIAESSAENMNIDLPGLKQVLSMYEELASKGHSEAGIQALYKLYLRGCL